MRKHLTLQLRLLLILIGALIALLPSQTSAQGYCYALPDNPYLDSIHQNVIVGAGWYCGGGYSSEVHIGIKVLAKPATGGSYSIIDIDSYWVYDQSNGSYYSSVPIAGCDMWYQIQFTVDGNLGYDFSTATSYLQACSGLPVSSPVASPAPAPAKVTYFAP